MNHQEASMLKRLKEDLKEAMKQKHTLDKSVIQGIISACDEARIKVKRELTDTEIIEVIRKENKMYMEALEGAKKANREDLATEAMLKAACTENYLPKLLTEDEILAEATALIMAQSLDTSNKGLLMKTFMPIFKGRADGKLVNQVISSLVK